MNAYLQRCLDLARLPGASVEPNPRVGAVIVHGDRIIGEGFHQQFGGPHAEVNAVNSVATPSLLSESTLYVSLEPCNHHGKTPPCAELILRLRIPKVVIGSLDPNPKMAGKSVKMLREHGVEVTVHSDPAPFQDLNRHFGLNQTKGRPFITLKWAESRDGFIAGTDPNDTPIRTAISSPGASHFVHYLRTQHQAILIGHNTVIVDNPTLNSRKWPGPDPVRIVFDEDCSLPPSLNIFGAGRLIILNQKVEKKEGDVKYLNISGSGLQEIMERLYREHQIGSILVEGGRHTHQQFIKADMWDECYQNISSNQLGKGIAAPLLSASSGSNLHLHNSFSDGADWIYHYRNG